MPLKIARLAPGSVTVPKSRRVGADEVMNPEYVERKPEGILRFPRGVNPAVSVVKPSRTNIELEVRVLPQTLAQQRALSRQPRPNTSLLSAAAFTRRSVR